MSILVLTWLLSTPAAASPQSPQSVDASLPRFAIETISVENLRKFPAKIILSTSLLTEGREYTEPELQEARLRIVRLPLILDAEFELRRGSSRGKYELVIEVTEARRWFFGLENRFTLWADEISVGGAPTQSTIAEQSLAGYRLPVGGDGLFFVTIGGTDGTLSLGYTQYNLFARSVIMSLKVSWSDCADVREDASSNELGEDGCATEIFDLGLDPTVSSWTLTGNNYRGRFNVSVPLDAKQSIRWLSSYRSVDHGFRRLAFRYQDSRPTFWDERRDLDTSLAWVYNSEDDSLFPTRGRFLEAGIAFRWLDADLWGFFPTYVPFRFDSRELRAQFAGKKHWPIRPATSLSLGLGGHLGRARVRDLPLADGTAVDDDLTTYGAAVELGHAHFLKRVINGPPKHPKRRPRWREWRWENGIELFYSGTSPDLGQLDNPLAGFKIRSGVVFRNTWGVFRLELAYTNIEGSR